MAHELADETLEKILAHVVAVPDDDFLDVSGMQSSPFARRQYSSSTVLLVCKRWMRVATPLLYDTVVLRSIAQAQALLKALTRFPEFAPFLKRLRLEGGFGAAVGSILRAAPHLRELHISLDFDSKDNIKPLCESLPSISPCCLALSLPSAGLITLKGDLVLDAIQTSAPGWTSLTTVVVPYYALSSPPMGNALLAMPNISEIRLKGYIYSLTQLRPILERLPQCKAHIDYEMIEPHDRAHTKAFIITHAEQLVIHRKDDLIPGPSGDRGRPLRNAPLDIQRRIWGLILQHALSFSDSDGVFADYWATFRSETGRPLAPIITSRAAINYMLVCRLFNDLCLPIALRHVSLQRDATVDSFLSLIDGQPELASGVESLFLTSTPHLNANFATPINLISRLSNLRRLLCCIDISDTVTLQTCAAGQGLHELDISYTMLPMGAAAGVPAAMTTSFAFPALRRLRLTLTFAFPRREPATPLLRIELPQLEELCFAGDTPGYLINYFAEAQFPNLRFFTSENEPDDGGALRNFFSAHGRGLQNIAVHPLHLGLVLELCPTVQTIILAFSRDMPWSLPLTRRVEPHMSLESLLLAGAVLHGPSRKAAKKIAQEGTAFFDAITPERFPALRDIVLARVQWPVLPRDIAGSPMLKWAGSLKEKGITLLDKSRTEWRPRLT